jgi:hypothetical protein
MHLPCIAASLSPLRYPAPASATSATKRGSARMRSKSRFSFPAAKGHCTSVAVNTDRIGGTRRAKNRPYQGRRAINIGTIEGDVWEESEEAERGR